MNDVPRRPPGDMSPIEEKLSYWIDEAMKARTELERLRAERPLPAPGESPCQTAPGDAPARLVAFLYRLLRDGAAAPSAVEEHAIAVAGSDKLIAYDNEHLRAYAAALATYLTTGADSRVA